MKGMKDQRGMVVLQDALMQCAAFQDVCYLAEAKGQEAWRRKMVFAQESGEAWQQIGTVCMDEVRLLLLFHQSNEERKKEKKGTKER